MQINSVLFSVKLSEQIQVVPDISLFYLNHHHNLCNE